MVVNLRQQPARLLLLRAPRRCALLDDLSCCPLRPATSTNGRAAACSGSGPGCGALVHGRRAMWALLACVLANSQPADTGWHAPLALLCTLPLQMPQDPAELQRALAEALSKVELLQQQVAIVEELQMHMEEQDTLITQLQELVVSNRREQVCSRLRGAQCATECRAARLGWAGQRSCGGMTHGIRWSEGHEGARRLLQARMAPDPAPP